MNESVLNILYIVLSAACTQIPILVEIALKISSKSVVSALTSCRAMTSGECSITHSAKPFLKAALTPLTLMVTTERLVGMRQV